MARRKTTRKTGTAANTSGEDAPQADAVEDAVVVSPEPGADAKDATDTDGDANTAADETNDAAASDGAPAVETVPGDLAEIDPIAGRDAEVPTDDPTPASDPSDGAEDDEAPAVESVSGDVVDSDPLTGDDTVVATDEAGTAMAADPDTPTEDEMGREPTAPPPVVTPPPAEGRRGPGFVPLVLGGVIAAALGWAAATFTTTAPPEMDPAEPAVDLARIDGLEQELRQVQADLADAPAAPTVDLSPVETAQADLSTRLDDLAQRIEALEIAAPAPADADAPNPAVEALAGLREEVAALDDRVAEVAGRVDTLAEDVGSTPDDIAARLDALEAQAADMGNAEAEAEAAMRRASQNELAIAVREGLPYDDAATALGDLPDVLTANAASGLPTRAALATAFPPLAREALQAARDGGQADEGLGGFARSLLGARSIEPREGSDPDAVLSRAEAAVRAGDLDAALAEIDALPAEAKAVLDDWTARARLWVDADAALQDYLEG